MQVITFALDEFDKRERYDSVLNACPDAFVQQTTQWADVIARHGPDRALFLLAVDTGQDVGALPLFLYHGGAGPILTSVPQAGPLGGVACRAGADRDAVYAALLKHAEGLARAHACIALTIITSPLCDDLALYRQYLQPSLIYRTFTQVLAVDQTVSHGQLTLGTHPTRNIRKAKAAGLVTAPCRTEDEFERWFAIHARRHGQLGLEPLNRDLLHDLWKILGAQGRSVLLLAKAGDTIAAGGLFVLHQHVWDMFMMNTDEQYWRHSPNYLLVESVLLDMHGRGARFLNWQSSARRNDGVYNFKRQWGSEEKLYAFVTKVFCEPDVILGLSKDGAQRKYPGHYLVPFGAFDAGQLAGDFSKL